MHTPKYPSFSQYDLFIIRNEINSFIKNNVKHLNGQIIDIGCGRMPYRDYILEKSKVENYTGLDIENPIYNNENFKPDIFWDGVKIPSEDQLYDSAILLEVLEHCEQPEIVIKEAYRVLKPGAKLLFSVPFLWYYHEAPYDYSRYTAYKLNALFTNAGFEIDEIVGYGNWNTALAHFWAMWVKRSKFPRFIRFGFYLIGLPFYFLLYRKGQLKSKQQNLDIFIGHYGCVTKPLK